MPSLQSIVFPNLEMHVTEVMYLRLDEHAWADLQAGCVHFQAGALLSTDTFFNGFTVGTWKRTCDVRTLALEFEGEGELVATIGLHRTDQCTVWLAEHRLDLDGSGPRRIALPFWHELHDGMLFCRMRALGPAVLRRGAFVTDDEPLNNVRLGMVITHFNRQAQTRAAVRRIRDELLDAPATRDRLTLTIVDNSRNLAIEPHPRIRHLPNRNLGGTGGFVRGMLELMDGHEHTHALFMDDDASCESASITRTLALLQFARKPAQAVAGALLRTDAPWELIEKGARFDGQVQPMHSGLDMRRVDDLLLAERPGPPPDYGAWWYFAFPLAQVQQFPFPFFVRGDDIYFGLVNRFDITTLNGVASLGEDFAVKAGPMTAYLDARYHLVHALLAPRGTASRLYWLGTRLFMKPLKGYLYDSARAVTLALEHIAQGPEFFRSNLDMQAVRAEVSSWGKAEALTALDHSTAVVRRTRSNRESRWSRLARALSLQGFLLPGWLLRDRMLAQPKSFHGRASQVFRYRRILYEHAPSGTGFVAQFDRPRFFSELGRFLLAWGRLAVQLPTLRRTFAAGAHDMSTAAFWRGVYRESVPAPANVAPRSEAVAATSEVVP